MTQSDANPALIETSMPPQHPDLAQEIERTKQVVDKIIKALVAAAILNALAIVALTIFVSPLFAGKIVLIEVMLMFSAICLGIVFGHGKIMNLLAQAEDIAYLVRDQAFVDLNMAREELRRLRKKLTRETDETGYTAVGELLKTVSPLVMMFIQKEKNIFRWGMFGLKIAQNAMAVLKQQQQRSKEQ